MVACLQQEWEGFVVFSFSSWPIGTFLGVVTSSTLRKTTFYIQNLEIMT